MTITFAGAQDEFCDALVKILQTTQHNLSGYDYTNGIVSAMNHGIYKSTSAAGWIYIADINALPESGIITPENIKKLVTAMGGWRFDRFEESNSPIGYAFNALNKALWSADNGWTSTLQLRLTADDTYDDTPATNHQLFLSGMVETPQWIVGSQSGKQDRYSVGFFPYGGCTGADPSDDVIDVFSTSGWSQFEDHVEAERGRRAMRELLAA